MTFQTSSSTRTFPIRYVSEKTGIKPITLRAWENRYGLLKPQRTASGHRLYSQADIDLIQRVVALINTGYSISQASDMVKNYDHHDLVGHAQQKHLVNFSPLGQALLNHNLEQATQDIKNLFALYSPEAFGQVIYPALHDYLNTQVWPQMARPDVWREMLLDRVIHTLQQSVFERDRQPNHRKVMVVGYRTGMIKSRILRGLLVANAIKVHGMQVDFCSGVSSLDAIAALEGYDLIIIFTQSDAYHLHQIDKIARDHLTPVCLSLIGPDRGGEHYELLPSNCTEIYGFIVKLFSPSEENGHDRS